MHNVLGELYLYILDAALLTKPYYRGHAVMLALSAKAALEKCDVGEAVKAAKIIVSMMPVTLRRRLNIMDRIRELSLSAREVCGGARHGR